MTQYTVLSPKLENASNTQDNTMFENNKFTK